MSILSAIGNTPLVEMTNLNKERPKVKRFSGNLKGVTQEVLLKIALRII